MATGQAKLDVCIIGAGWAGLLACKYALSHGLSVRVLEQRSDLGGVWNYTKDPEFVTVMDSTITSSSATVTEASDFYMDDKLGQFLHQKDVHRYLRQYAEHFGLLEHIRFNTKVNQLEKRQTQDWLIDCQEEQIIAANVVVCSGINGERKPLPQDIQDFQGPILHSVELKSIESDQFDQNDNVLVYGGGESASDVIELLSKTKAKVTWSIPNGQHFFRKVALTRNNQPGVYDLHGGALDEASSRFVQHVSPFVKSKPGMRWLCTLGSTGSVFGFEGHGIAAWKKDVPFMHAMVNKNGHAVEYVHSGRVMAKGKIESCQGNRVTFADGEQHQYTQVILCTGYRTKFDFLPEALANKCMTQRYKKIFDTDDSSLLFIGYVRPTVGSIPLMAEMQCRYAFKVLAGQIDLPDKNTMDEEAAKEIEFWNDYFYYKRRGPTLVEPFIYGHDLARLSGCMPHYGKLFLQSPLVFFKTYFSPMSNAHFNLNDKTTRDSAVKQIWSRQSTKWFILPWIYILSRLLRVDNIVDFIDRRRQQKAFKADKTKVCEKSCDWQQTNTEPN